jgi:hypothetical protein
MPSSFTTSLGIEKPATGEQTGIWGNTSNLNVELIEQAITGSISLVLPATGTSGAPNALVMNQGGLSNARNLFIDVTDAGDLGGDVFVRMDPNTIRKVGYFKNSLSASRKLILFQGTYDSGRDLEVLNGQCALVLFSGSGATSTAINLLSGFTLPSLTVLGAASLNGTTVPNAKTLVTLDDTQTLQGKTVQNVVFSGSYTEQVFTITDGAAVNLDPINGTIQVWTLGADRTPTATGFDDGQSLTLMINDGTGFTITWPSVTWIGGVAPPLSPTGFTIIGLFKVGGVLYGEYGGATV